RAPAIELGLRTDRAGVRVAGCNRGVRRGDVHQQWGGRHRRRGALAELIAGIRAPAVHVSGEDGAGEPGPCGERGHRADDRDRPWRASCARRTALTELPEIVRTPADDAGARTRAAVPVAERERLRCRDAGHLDRGISGRDSELRGAVRAPAHHLAGAREDGTGVPQPDGDGARHRDSWNGDWPRRPCGPGRVGAELPGIVRAPAIDRAFDDCAAGIASCRDRAGGAASLRGALEEAGIAGEPALARLALARRVLRSGADEPARSAVVHVLLRRHAGRPAAVLLGQGALQPADGLQIDAAVVDQAGPAGRGEEEGREEPLHRLIPNSTTTPSEPCGRSVDSPFSLKSWAPKDPSSPTRTGPRRVVTVAVGPAKRSPPDLLG